MPAASVAVQVTMVIPSANVVPDPGVQFTGREPSMRSAAVGWIQLTWVPFAPVVSLIMSDDMPSRRATWTTQVADVPFPFFDFVLRTHCSTHSLEGCSHSHTVA